MAITVLEYAIFGRLAVGGHWGIGVACGVAAWVAAIVVAMLFRQRRAREYRILLREQGIVLCLDCGYDLRGQTVPRCPECGRPFDPALLKQRGEKEGRAAR